MGDRASLLTRLSDHKMFRKPSGALKRLNEAVIQTQKALIASLHYHTSVHLGCVQQISESATANRGLASGVPEGRGAVRSKGLSSAKRILMLPTLVTAARTKPSNPLRNRWKNRMASLPKQRRTPLSWGSQ